MKKFIILAVILFSLFAPINIYAADKPLPNTIANVQISKQTDHKVLISWRQVSKYTLVVYKLSYDRKIFNNCSSDIETFTASYCKVLWIRTIQNPGNIRITDRDYKKGDEYYVLQYAYQTHNGAYGPFTP